MEVSRTQAQTPRVKALSVEISGLHGPCVGCQDCVGLCTALIEALVLPDVILTRKRESE